MTTKVYIPKARGVLLACPIFLKSIGIIFFAPLSFVVNYYKMFGKKIVTIVLFRGRIFRKFFFDSNVIIGLKTC